MIRKQFACRDCGSKIQADEYSAESVIECPKCARQQVVPREKIRLAEIRINRDAKNLPMICSVCGGVAEKYEQREFHCKAIGGWIGAATEQTAKLLLPVCERHTRRGGPTERTTALKYGAIGIACLAILIVLLMSPLPQTVKAIGSLIALGVIGVALYLGTARGRESARIVAVKITPNAIILDGVSATFAENMQDHVDDPEVMDFLKDLENME